MAIIHRRVFQAKVGQSAPLVEHFLAAVKQMKSHGINWDTRICSDYYSGRSDRVSVEWLLDGLTDIDTDLPPIFVPVAMLVPQALGWALQSTRPPEPVVCSPTSCGA